MTAADLFLIPPWVLVGEALKCAGYYDFANPKYNYNQDTGEHKTAYEFKV